MRTALCRRLRQGSIVAFYSSRARTSSTRILRFWPCIALFTAFPGLFYPSLTSLPPPLLYVCPSGRFSPCDRSSALGWRPLLCAACRSISYIVTETAVVMVLFFCFVFFITFYFPAKLVGGVKLLDTPWSLLSTLFPPPVRDIFVFVAHRVQHSHLSIFIEWS